MPNTSELLNQSSLPLSRKAGYTQFSFKWFASDQRLRAGTAGEASSGSRAVRRPRHKTVSGSNAFRVRFSSKARSVLQLAVFRQLWRVRDFANALPDVIWDRNEAGKTGSRDWAVEQHRPNVHSAFLHRRRKIGVS